MVVDRRNQMSSNLLESFIKLLEYDEIKLIVPEIVEYETYKHLEKELDQVGKNIEVVMDKIKDLYGVTAYKIAGLNIEEYKKKSRSQLDQALTMFSQGKNSYKQGLFNTMKMVFEHRNSIHITDDNFLNTLVMKRRIYKKAPFHKEQKESYADGLIAETLINLKKYIELQECDEIYFVTGNYKDFCDTEKDKNKLHPHILCDLEREGLDKQVIYVNKFGKLIQAELHDNVENAKLTEEFEKELEREREVEEEIWKNDYQDMIRESAGLSSLGSFESMVEDNLVDSEFQQDIVNIFEEINVCYQNIEELNFFYDEELLNYIQECDVSECNKIIDIFQALFEQFGGPVIAGGKVSDLGIILEWIEEQKYILREIPYENSLPDHINFGEKITIFDCNHKEFVFELEELYLSPDNGSSDQIDISIKRKTQEICAEGYIEVTYGFIEFDDDGGAGDGCEEEIAYYYHDIIEFMKKIHHEWTQFMEKQTIIFNYLKEKFSLD